jgi:hypothetical protein
MRIYTSVCLCLSLNELTEMQNFCRNLIDDYSVRAGTNTNYQGGTVHRVVEWAYHEDYVNDAYWYNDIAVLKVKIKIKSLQKL